MNFHKIIAYIHLEFFLLLLLYFVSLNLLIKHTVIIYINGAQCDILTHAYDMYCQNQVLL